MSLNNGIYCKVDQGTVVSGPRNLPQNDGDNYNINNSDIWSDVELIAIGWYPTNIITPEYDPVTQYYGGWLFDVFSTYVDATREVIDKTQEQIDKEKPTELTQSQQTAADLADQTRDILARNTSRLNVGADEIIPANDVADTESYLATLYTAVDDSSVNPVDPIGTIRQAVIVPQENRDRMIVFHGDHIVNTQPYWSISARLYTHDAKGMSLKIHNENGVYLWTQPFVEVAPGEWLSEPQNASNMWPGSTYEDRHYVIFQGKDISQMRLFPGSEQEHVRDVRWTEGNEFVDGGVQ